MTCAAFYISLLTPPSEDYLHDVAFFLSVGEQAPFKSVTDVYRLTPQEREYWVKKLSEMYQKQKEAMEKQNRRSKSR